VSPTVVDPVSTDAVVRPVIVGSDIGVYALARSFHERYGVTTTVVAFAEPGPIANSRIIDLVLSGSAGAEIVATLVRLAREHTGPAQLLALTNMDWVVRELVHHRAELEAAGYVVPFADAAVIDRISDKAEFLAACEELGVPTPATVVQDFAHAADPGWQPQPVPFTFPVIAKPASSADYHGVRFAGKKKIFEIADQAELDRLYASLREAGFRGRFLVQDMVPGDDTQMRSVTTYTDSSGRVTLRCSARVLLEERTPATRGNPSAMIVEEIPQILDAAARLHAYTGWRGFANFDVKLDPRDGVYRFFEQNPRIGRNNYYVTAGGQNPTEVLVDDVVRRLRREPVTARNEVLYATVPHRLVRRYVLDPALNARVVRLMRAKKTVHPLWYRADLGWRRRLYVVQALLNHVRKYRTYYPMDELRRVHAGNLATSAGSAARTGTGA
jgi:D-aspartate ligase